MEQSGSERPAIPAKDRNYIAMQEMFRQSLGTWIASSQDRDTRILSVNCRGGSDARPLLDLLPKATYYGIDQDPRSIEHAKRNNISPKTTFERVGGYDSVTLGVGEWDLVVLRNPRTEPPILNVPYQDWHRVIDSTIAAAKEGGRVFISTNEPERMEAVRQHIASKGEKLEIELDRENKDPADEVYKDNYLLVVKHSV